MCGSVQATSCFRSDCSRLVIPQGGVVHGIEQSVRKPACKPAMTIAADRITLSANHDLAAVEAAWRELEADAAPSLFQSWTWIGCLAEERFRAPVLLRAERNGRTVGLALLSRTRSRLGAEQLWLNES